PLSWWERPPANVQQLSEAIDRLRSSLPLLAPPTSPAKQNTREARNTPSAQPPPDPLKERLASESVTFTRVLLLQVGSVADPVADQLQRRHRGGRHVMVARAAESTPLGGRDGCPQLHPLPRTHCGVRPDAALRRADL